jgi:membrane protease YdiL (CAAX protease family)
MNVVPDNAAETTAAPVLSIMLIVIVGGIGEEIGWRSFLQTTLEKRLSVLVSSIIVGTMWGLWHIDRWGLGIAFMSVMVLQTVSNSIIMAAVLKDTKNSIIISTMFHASFNIGFIYFLGYGLRKQK